MKLRYDTQVHERPSYYEDLDLEGQSYWHSECSCGWVSPPTSTPGIAQGRWRKHLVLAGRGAPRKRS